MSAVPALSIILLRNPPSLGTARIVSAGIPNPAVWQNFPAGDTIPFSLSISDGAGNLETLTGRTYRVGIGNLNAPCTGGTFTVADSLGATTAALPYNVTAAALTAALNLLNGGAGPNSGTVLAQGPAGGPFVIVWNANGARTLLAANVTDLEPAAIAIVAEVQLGSGMQPEVQLMRLVQLPYALQSTLTVSGTTATGSLVISSAGLYEWLAQNPGGNLFFEVEENDGTTIKKICQAPIQVTGDVVPYTNLSSIPALSNQNSGLVWLPWVTLLTGGVSTPQITSLDLIPTVSLPVITTGVEFYNQTASLFQGWQLFASSAATGSGVQRPADYNAVTNAKVWFELF